MDRRVTVNVALNASGNLAQAASAAATQAAKLNQAAKGASAAAGAARAASAASAASAAAAGSAPAIRATSAAAGSAPAIRATSAAAGGATLSQTGWLASAGQRSISAMERLADRIEPLTRAAGIAGAVGLAASYGGIASVSPEASSQIRNSFAMIGNEIGIATIPAAVRFTGVLQGLARTIRTVNESTGGVAGNLFFTGALLATGVGALGMASRFAANAASGLRSLGLLAEVAAPVAGQVAGRAVAGAATGTGATAATSAGTSAGTGGAAAAGGGSTMGALMAGPLGFMGPGAIIGGLIELISGRNLPTGSSMGIGLATGGNVFGPGAIGLGGGAAPADVAERHPQAYGSALELYQSMAMQAQETPGPLAEQEGRAMVQWLQAISGQLGAIQAQGAAGGGSFAAPPAGENG